MCRTGSALPCPARSPDRCPRPCVSGREDRRGGPVQSAVLCRDGPPTAGRFHTGTFHTGTGVRQEIAGLHPATETARHPSNFFPVFCPEFPEKSGRDRLAAYCPHSQPHCRFSPLQIWSGFMPFYQWVKNQCFRQRRFTRPEIPPNTREVSTGVFHHPFRVFRLA